MDFEKMARGIVCGFGISLEDCEDDAIASVAAAIRSAYAAGREDAAKVADAYAAGQEETALRLRGKYPDGARAADNLAGVSRNIAAAIRSLPGKEGE